METDRNLANIGRKTGISGQNMQHFVSNSTWSGEEVILAVENEVKTHPAFQEAILVLDESAEEKSGEQSAGAGRQHNGRLGKIEMSQVGVFLALVTPNVCIWVDGELYLPITWFEDSARKACFSDQTRIGLGVGQTHARASHSISGRGYG